MEKEFSVSIDSEKCTGCGLCVSDCQRRDLKIENNKAVPLNTACFLCGHCVAICPENAVKLNGLDDKIWEIPAGPVFLDEKSLMNHLRFRRSIRHYKNTPVEKDKLEKIIEAGRITPSASNTQNVRYMVIQNEINEIEDTVIAQYKNQAGLSSTYSFPPDRYKRGFLFHNATAIVLVISPREINACLAAMNMELMAEALGLGVVYVGLFTAPANANKDLRASLEIAEDENIFACLALGYPTVTYKRSAPRKKANIIWR